MLLALKVDRRKYVLLPTGDGICIAFTNLVEPYDIHLRSALSILRRVSEANKVAEKENQRFNVRIGINENNDTRIVDINKRQNIAGSGINLAQRIMNIGDGGNILVGQTVYEKLVQREKYHDSFHKYYAQIKHSESLIVYQYLNKKYAYLNCESPSIFKIEAKASNVPSVPSNTLACFLVLIGKYTKQIERINKSASDLHALSVALSYYARTYATFYRNKIDAVKGPLLDPAKAYDSKTNEIDLGKAKDYFEELYFIIVEDLYEKFRDNLFGKEEHRYLFEKDSQYLKISKSGAAVLKKHFKDMLATFRYDLV
jgi:hypothetical protein